MRLVTPVGLLHVDDESGETTAVGGDELRWVAALCEADLNGHAGVGTAYQPPFLVRDFIIDAFGADRVVVLDEPERWGPLPPGVVSAPPVEPCTCECNSGGYCGCCGHAGCGGRR